MRKVTTDEARTQLPMAKWRSFPISSFQIIFNKALADTCAWHPGTKGVSSSNFQMVSVVWKGEGCVPGMRGSGDEALMELLVQFLPSPALHLVTHRRKIP